MNRYGFIILSLIVLLSPLSIFAEDEDRTKQRTDKSVVDGAFNIPLTVIRQTSYAVQNFSPQNSQTVSNIFKIPISTLEAVNNLVKNTSRRTRRDVNSGENNSDEEEERTLHHIKKKKHKFQHHQKPSHYGYFGQPILFPGLYSRPTAWKPSHAVPQIINIFNQGSHGSYGPYKPHHHKPFYKPIHKPHGSHTSGHYQVWEDNHEEFPIFSGGFFGLGPQYPTAYQNKVAPRGRQYRSYTTAPLSYGTSANTISIKNDLNSDPDVQHNKLVFRD